MRYLGIVRREGVLGEAGRAGTLELECYEHHAGAVMASGELEAPRSTIAMFRLKEKIEFTTLDGHRIDLVLSDAKQLPSGGYAQVTASGDLPSMRSGSLGWPSAKAG